MSDLIINVIGVVLEHPAHLIKVFTRDGCAINGLAISRLLGGEVDDPNTGARVILRGVYPRAIDVKCYSHTLDNIGADFKLRGVQYNRLEGPQAKQCYNHLNGMMAGASDKPNNLWRRMMMSAFPSVSNVRWWSREEFWEYVLRHLDPTENRVDTLVSWVKQCYESKLLEGVHIKALYNLFVPGAEDHDAMTLKLTLIQIAISVDVSHPIRQSTYNLEGTGPLAPFVMTEINKVHESFETFWEEMQYTNVHRFIVQYTAEAIRPPGAEEALPIVDAWVTYCKTIAAPARQYFYDKIMAHPSNVLFEAARLVNPYFMKSQSPSVARVRDLLGPMVESNFITDAHRTAMITDYVQQKLKFQTFDSANWLNKKFDEQVSSLQGFWAEYSSGSWATFAFLCYLLQPSSASVERVFSVLKYIYTDVMENSLTETTQTKLMLRFNHGLSRQQPTFRGQDDGGDDDDDEWLS